MQNKSKRACYGVAVAAFFVIAIVIGLANNIYSLYIVPVTDDLGVSRSAFSASQSLRCLAALGSSLLFAGVYRRFGYRRPTTLCILMTAVSYLAYSRARNLLPFYLGALVYGLGESFMYAAGMSRLINNWFSGRAGTVLGVVMAASGLGGAVMSLLLSAIIRAAGWRSAYLSSVGFLLLAAALVFFVLRDSPRERGLQPLEDDGTRPRAASARRVQGWDGVPLRQLTRKPFFYLTLLTLLLSCFVTFGAYGVIVAHFQDQGLSMSFSAGCLSLLLLMLSASKVLVGMLSDRVGAYRASMLCLLCQLASVLLLAVTRERWQAIATVVLFAFALCMQGFTEPLLAAELFGRAAYNSSMGLMLAMVYAGGLVAGPVVNRFYDLAGSYTPVLLALGALSAALPILLALAHRAQQRFRRCAEAQAGGAEPTGWA